MLTKENIKEIADELDCGFSCYYNKQDNELLFIPDLDNHPDMEMDAWKPELRKIRKHPKKYKKIGPPEPFESFRIMEDFIDTLPDNNMYKSALTSSLRKPKPFRHFKFTIDNSGDLRQEWFDFKSLKLQEKVEDELGLGDDMTEFITPASKKFNKVKKRHGKSIRFRSG